uniref:Ras protein-specific guanine nucleotide-releasing factor 2a n=1 Tax=Astyanax mexicanus TaxID=7994 RepID=A0A8B9GZP1_ASTMX
RKDEKRKKICCTDTLCLKTVDAHDVTEICFTLLFFNSSSYSDLIIEREVLMQKYIHLVQILETEKVAANQLRTQLEDQDTEIERLKSEIVVLNKTKERMLPFQSIQDEEDPDIKKIKKVQSFMRGWLCRRKWKIIVQDYICSPHAESMRKRNQIVFNMVEAETEYVLQLSILVNCFLRPLRMAASSKKPPISHDDVSSVFLNSETIMFLHEIFHQGLKARIANWPTLVLADLFDILLPMLNIYQEFVRNHQYSLQVLANCKQNRDFDKLLKQYESNAACEGRMLETFLTYPMFQIPRYIITLHELLAHTPHEHVERKSLEFAKSKLEELSKMMHDEVSDTENIRKNLAIERMIVEGCDILLDTSQTFVRQGSLIQLPSAEKGKLSKVRLGSLSLRKEGERQCFLFTKHLLICTRTSGGKLHLLKQGGTLSLIECTLIEELDANDEDYNAAGQGFSHLEFKVVVEPPDGSSFSVVLLAPSRQEKAAWTSDISQVNFRTTLWNLWEPKLPVKNIRGFYWFLGVFYLWRIFINGDLCSDAPLFSRWVRTGQSAEGSRCAMSPASAFAIATAAAGHSGPQGFTNPEKSYDKEFLIRRAATNRVLNVLRHWVSKHSQDFDMNGDLKAGVFTLLEEVLRDPDLLPQERKATGNILSALSQEEPDDSQLKIEDILQMAEYPKSECFESLSAMELAEQITLLDHIVFRSIPYEEFLGQGWMKVDKNEKTPYIMKTSQHFNDIYTQPDLITDHPSQFNSVHWIVGS